MVPFLTFLPPNFYCSECAGRVLATILSTLRRIAELIVSRET
jgi:hypothetical protein